MGIGLIATGLLPVSGLKAFFVLAFLMGITIPFYHGVLSSIYQTNISPVYLGRVFSLTSSVRMIAMPLGLILSGTFAEIIGVTKRTIERTFKSLQEKKMIERIGSKRDGNWIVVR